MSGAGSVAARRAALNELMARATASEQAFLRALVLGDIRQGALAAVVGDAVAKAAGVPVAAVRRALMLRGDLGAVAEAALGEGEDALAAFRLEVGRPIAPMLAQTAPDVEAALAKTGPAAVEWKLDGARIQVHRDGEDGRDLHAHARRRDGAAARGRRGGAVAAGARVRARRRGDRAARGRPAASVPGHGQPVREPLRRMLLTPMFFDLLHLDGEDLLDRPGSERAAALSALVPSRGGCRAAGRRCSRRRSRGGTRASS